MKNLFLLLIIYLFLHNPIYSNNIKYRITAFNLNVYFKPDVNSKVISKIKQGVVVTLLKSSEPLNEGDKHWIKIKLKNNISGYIFAKDYNLEKVGSKSKNTNEIDTSNYKNILIGKIATYSKNIIPGKMVGIFEIGKPIPKNTLKLLGRPDKYNPPTEGKDSGSLYWKNGLLIKLNDGNDICNVNSIYIYDSCYKVYNKFGIGSHFNVIKNNFPNGKMNVDNSIVTWTTPFGIYFTFIGKKVNTIVIYKKN